MQFNTPNDGRKGPKDSQLIEQIQAQTPGSRECFGTLVARHQSALYARCMSYLRHPEDAADAAQETLLRAYRAIHRFKGDAAFRTWLFAIADNQCHTLARKRARQPLPEEHVEEMVLLQQVPEEPAPLTDESTGDCVHSALEQITAKGRDVLQLRYFADLTIEEIAVTLGVGISATKMRLYRAQEQVAGLIDACTLSRAA